MDFEVVDRICENMFLKDLSYAFYNASDEGKREMYYNVEHNNMIVFINPWGFSLESICTDIDPSAQDNLISILDQNSNVLVIWEKSQEPISDYIIFHDVDAKNYLYKSPSIIKSELIQGVKNSLEMLKYKYIEVRGSAWTKLNAPTFSVLDKQLN